MTSTDEVIGHTSNFALQAILILVGCLKSQRALTATQYEHALRATIEAEGAPKERLDYVLLENLLKALEKQPPAPPDVDAIH
jgi:hypothetical protein